MIQKATPLFLSAVLLFECGAHERRHLPTNVNGLVKDPKY